MSLMITVSKNVLGFLLLENCQPKQPKQIHHSLQLHLSNNGPVEFMKTEPLQKLQPLGEDSIQLHYHVKHNYEIKVDVT